MDKVLCTVISKCVGVAIKMLNGNNKNNNTDMYISLYINRNMVYYNDAWIKWKTIQN